MKKTVIKFLVSVSPYQRGEIAGFDPEQAKKLIDAKKAELYKADAKSAAGGKKGSGGKDEPTREDLNKSLAALPGGNTDPDYVIGAMRDFYGELFTDEDAEHVREVVKQASDSSGASKQDPA